MRLLIIASATTGKRFWQLSFLLLLVLLASVKAFAAPAALYGKSVVISWSEVSQQRRVGEENFRSVARNVNMSIYISNLGRVFSRQTNTTRAGTGATEQVAGQPSGSRPARIPSFSGQSMTVYGPAQGQGGVRRIVVEFGQGFNGCSAHVAFAKEEGRATFRGTSPITGAQLEIASVTPAEASCSVRSGNVFGGE
jgi:hypothetical protein